MLPQYYESTTDKFTYLQCKVTSVQLLP